jgi:hypothetical protein
MLNALIRLAYNKKHLRTTLLPLLREHTAKIVMPLRHTESGEKVFIARLAKQLQVFVTRFSAYQKQLPAIQSDFRSFLGEADVGMDILRAAESWEVKQFLKLSQDIQKHTTWDNDYAVLWGALSKYVAYGVLDAKLKTDLDHLVSASSEFTQILEDLGLEDFDPEVLQTLKDMTYLYVNFQEMWAQAKDRISATRRPSQRDDGEFEMPKGSVKQETLYHASIHARELFKSGFQSELPAQSGLGGSQSAAKGMKGTSFTYDLHIAKEISRTLKELVLIAKGKLKASDVIHWASVEGVLEKVFKIETLHRPFTAEVTGKRVKFFSGDSPVEASQVFSTPLRVATLYLWFIVAMDAKRYDPRVMYLDRLLPKLAQANYQDIGVVVVTVDMEHSGVRHLPGERELRVPPEAIVSVDKFLS